MTWRRRLPVVLLTLCVLEALALAFWLRSCLYRIQVTATEPSWIVIEYRNPKCPRLPPSVLGRQVIVPSDGYVCFSDEPWVGPMVLRVHDRNGRKVGDERIRRFGGSTVNKGKCQLVADGFFFGTDQELVQSGQDVGSKLEAHHPECQ